jgi:mRNA-degrading endonuclease RelE of RelBE toxin-antitoxin system
MVKITPSNTFKKNVKGLEQELRDRLEKQIRKIIENPTVGKPLKYKRGERSLYIKPFRLIYAIRGDEIILLKFEHRSRVYKD